ncbi:MAG: hypothetical protein V4674_00655 [Patescibacteria group bacterium]
MSLSLTVHNQVQMRGMGRFFGAVLLARFLLQNRLLHNMYAGSRDIPEDPYHPIRRIVILAQLRRFLEKSEDILADPYMGYLLNEHYAYHESLVASMKAALGEMRECLLRRIKKATEHEAGLAARKQFGELYEVPALQAGETLVLEVLTEVEDEEFGQMVQEQFAIMEKVQLH